MCNHIGSVQIIIYNADDILIKISQANIIRRKSSLNSERYLIAEDK